MKFQMKKLQLRQTSLYFFRSGERISLESLDRHPYQPHLHVTGAADGIIGVWDIRHERYPVTLIEAHDNEGTSY